jgi:hypothetical protein
MKYFYFTFFLVLFCNNSLFSQKTEGIYLDMDEPITDTIVYVNIDSIKRFQTEEITNAYVLDGDAWFSNDEFTLVEKLNFISENRSKSFEYFYFTRSGKIEVSTNISDKDVKFAQETKLIYGAWFIDKDKLNIVLNGFNLIHGKFEYRIVYDYKKSDNNINLKIVDKKLINEEK